MSYDHAGISWGLKQVTGMIRNGNILFDNVIQRSYVWEATRRSLFIHSLALGIPIPDTYAKRYIKDSKKYDMLDGKQRLITIANFINDEFALTKLPPVTFFNDLTGMEETEDISGKKFSQISEGLREKITNQRIKVIYFDDLTKEEEKELFKRINNGKPLSTKSRSLASCLDIEKLLDIGTHDLFKEMLSQKALDSKNQAIIVMKSWCMINQDIEDISFASKDFNILMENTEISDEEKLKLVQVFDYICNIHETLIGKGEKKIAKKLYTETHLVSLIPFLSQASTNEIEEENVADWIIEFFKTEDGSASISEDYNNAISGSAKKINIQIRNSALKNSFSDFFKVDE